jgi:dipeptidyl aminopeptidase/acylaminoacyl peptidase
MSVFRRFFRSSFRAGERRRSDLHRKATMSPARHTIASRVHLAVALTLLLSAVISGCGDAAPPSDPTRSLAATPEPPVATPGTPPNVDDAAPFPAGRLAFEVESYATRSGDYPGSLPRIYAINTDGTGLLALTPAGEIGRAPAWSSDGSRLAYESWHVDAAEIWTVRADGTGRTLVAREATEPFWLDDTHLGFQCGTSLCAIRDDGSERRVLLARNAMPNAADFGYRLSPDGRTILFTRYFYFGPDAPSSYVYVMNADGTGERRLTPDGQGDSPRWSPVGRKVAFASARYGTAVVDVDGGTVTSVYGKPTNPAWSPTGTALVFWDRDGFYLAHVDGRGPTRRVSLPISFSSDVAYAVNAWAWTAH